MLRHASTSRVNTARGCLLTLSSKYGKINAQSSDYEWRSEQNMEDIGIGLQNYNHTWQLPNAKHGYSPLGVEITSRENNYVTRQCMYNVTLRRVRATIVTMEK